MIYILLSMFLTKKYKGNISLGNINTFIDTLDDVILKTTSLQVPSHPWPASRTCGHPLTEPVLLALCLALKQQK